MKVSNQKIKSKLSFGVLILLSLFVMGLSSCGSTEEDEITPDVSSENYIPLTTGTYWTYSGGITDDYTVTMTGNEKEINGRLYKEASSTISSASGYMCKENNSYYIYSGQTVQGFSIDLELLVLKENEPVGTKWQQIVTVDNGLFELPTTYSFEIIGKDLTRTVNGTEFKDVIHVRMVSTFEFAGEVLELGTNDNYYAKGVGPIFTESDLSPDIILKDYQIK